MTATRPTIPPRQRIIRYLQLVGRGQRTQEPYVRAVGAIATQFRWSLDLLTELQVRDYFLCLKIGWLISRGALKVTPQ